KALEFFKDWTNYLLVTTVAVLSWIASAAHPIFSSSVARAACLVAFALSIVFGIFTLALIPLVQEARQTNTATTITSNYSIHGEFWLFGPRRLRLKSVCFPQHVFFLFGIVVFVIGTLWPPLSSNELPAQIASGPLTALDWCIIVGAALVVALIAY